MVMLVWESFWGLLCPELVSSPELVSRKGKVPFWIFCLRHPNALGGFYESVDQLGGGLYGIGWNLLGQGLESSYTQRLMDMRAELKGKALTKPRRKSPGPLVVPPYSVIFLLSETVRRLKP